MDELETALKESSASNLELARINQNIKSFGPTKSKVKRLEEMGIVKAGLSEKYGEHRGQLDLHQIGNESAAALVVLALISLFGVIAKLFNTRKNTVIEYRIKAITLDKTYATARTENLHKARAAAEKNNRPEPKETSIEYDDIKLSAYMDSKNIPKIPFLAVKADCVKTAYLEAGNELLSNTVKTCMDILEKVTKLGEVQQEAVYVEDINKCLVAHANHCKPIFNSVAVKFEDHVNNIAKVKLPRSLGAVTNLTNGELIGIIDTKVLSPTDLIKEVNSTLDKMKRFNQPPNIAMFVNRYIKPALTYALKYHMIHTDSIIISASKFGVDYRRARYDEIMDAAAALLHAIKTKESMDYSKMMARAFKDGVIAPRYKVDNNPPSSVKDYKIKRLAEQFAPK